jgi:hypothetical protein
MFAKRARGIMQELEHKNVPNTLLQILKQANTKDPIYAPDKEIFWEMKPYSPIYQEGKKISCLPFCILYDTPIF